ncbi:MULTISPECIES: beta-ketoacyl synthase N-terminal-like domain-containing protein [unclassified Nostoc]|uniref:type I polyketide synthase n=1 Tax=unclassified Nostoc TaxID=2593658 RepID=UPI0025D32D38|nr:MULTISPECIES: beta-ketoacyl synthase N-terminal-like domain-containing protein [unclassified Nostoc]
MNSDQAQSPSPIKQALRAIETLQAQLDALKYAQQEPIAIIGTGCRFPGGAENPEAFWRLLRDGVDAITEVPADRWDLEKYYNPEPDMPGKVCTREGGFLTGVDTFNPEFFGISAREAASTDPQQRLLLEVTWEALENASQVPEHLHNTSTGTFIGIYLNDYSKVMSSVGDVSNIDAFSAIGNSLSIAAGRLSYFFGLKGPSMAVDTSCSSSLVSVHLACQSLRLKECNLALAGGVGLNLVPDTSIALSRTRMLNPDGRCKTFDAAANGFVKGEGCGIVVLKRLSDALADGDNILALIRGSAVNHNGRSSSLISPNGLSQQAVIRQALENGDVEPAQVDYVEVQGTSTSVGEPIEVAALEAVYGKNRPEDKPLVIGSVKTNIGHLEPASGIASLIKVVLALQHGEIPAHLHFKQPNPHINWNELPLKVPAQRMPWPITEKRRLAGVSAFGFSGTNAHVVVQEAPQKIQNSKFKIQNEDAIERSLHLLTLSAKTDEALVQLAERYEKHLANNPDLALEDICFSANTGRSHFQYRISAIASSSAELYKKLAAFSAGQKTLGLFHGKVTDSPKIAFLFPDTGSEYVGMGRQLYETQPKFRQAFDRCNEILRFSLKCSLVEILYPESATSSLLKEAVYRQPALFAIEYALFQLWKSWGVEPTAVMGYGVGEFVAACVAEVFSLEDSLKLIVQRGRLMQALPPEGKMVEVFGSENQGILKEVTYSQSQIPLVSHLTGELTTSEIATPLYWSRQAQQPLKVAAAIDNLAQQGYEIFVEVGAKPTFVDCLPNVEKLWLSTLNPGKDDWQQILESLASLYARGVKVDWLGFDRDYSRQNVELPTYPWQRKRYWFEPNHNGHKKVEISSQNNGFLAQADSQQLIEQLEMSGELSKEELNLLPKLLGLLTKQHEFVGTKPKQETPNVVQEINVQSLTVADIQVWLTNQIANDLGVQPDEINIQVPFDSYGLDSVLAIAIASAGKQSLGIDMSPLLLVHYPTIESLSQHLARELEASDSEIFEI